jgi:hypothetical protein
MGKLKSEKYADGSMAYMITALFLPESGMSERTESTQRDGARRMIQQLIAGDLRPSYHNPEQDEFMTEFLRRVLENASKQGFELPATEDTGGNS